MTNMWVIFDVPMGQDWKGVLKKSGYVALCALKEASVNLHPL